MCIFDIFLKPKRRFTKQGVTSAGLYISITTYKKELLRLFTPKQTGTVAVNGLQSGCDEGRKIRVAFLSEMCYIYKA